MQTPRLPGCQSIRRRNFHHFGEDVFTRNCSPLMVGELKPLGCIPALHVENDGQQFLIAVRTFNTFEDQQISSQLSH